MDTSKEFILQCEKAEEIQKGWKPEEGDYVFIRWGENVAADSGVKLLFKDYSSETNDGDLFYEYDNTKYYPSAEQLESDYSEKKVIRLPRQDQLQIMVIKEKEEIFCLLRRFYKFANFETGMLSLPSGSMEKLWLAFVMKEKYNKVWNGKDWEVLGGEG